MWALGAYHWLCGAPVDSFQREEEGANFNFHKLQPKKPEHALSHEGIPTDHTAGIKQLQEATPVCNALGKEPAHRQFSGHKGCFENRGAGLETELPRPGTGIRKHHRAGGRNPAQHRSGHLFPSHKSITSPPTHRHPREKSGRARL